MKRPRGAFLERQVLLAGYGVMVALVLPRCAAHPWLAGLLATAGFLLTWGVAKVLYDRPGRSVLAYLLVVGLPLGGFWAGHPLALFGLLPLPPLAWWFQGKFKA